MNAQLESIASILRAGATYMQKHSDIKTAMVWATAADYVEEYLEEN